MKKSTFTYEQSYYSKKRLLIGAIITGFFFLLYTAYLFSMQIVHGIEHKRRAEEVARRVIAIPAQRGEIYDRNYDVPLVMNIDSFALDIIPGEIDGRIQEIAERISTVIDVNPEEILQKIPDNSKNLFRPVEVASGIHYETIAYIAERIQEFPGVTWHSKPIRSYVETGSISHILGYVGEITREELQILYNEGYEVRTTIGKAGVEKYYDQILRGQAGKQFRTVDVRGRNVTETVDEVPPVLGKNIVLTLDRDIQELCEKALGERIGSVLALKPATGEIVAMVSYPWYDPNQFYTNEGSEVYKNLSLDPEFPFLNRTIQANYPPASMFKIVMTTAALEEEAIPIEKTIVCEGSIEFGDRVFHCHKKTGHGPLSLYDGLAQSCNVFFWTLGRDYLGIEKIVDYSSRFGFGSLTGVDLPGEVKGFVPSPSWKESVYHTKWMGGDTLNISIGQGYLTVTPIQVANMVSLIVNEGVVYRPHVLKEIRDPISGNILKKEEPVVLRSSTIRKSTYKNVQKAMRGVITEGTPKVVVTTDAVELAGKTGTGQVGLADRWSSWFTAYGPYSAEDPEERIVLVVMVEGTNEWEWWAPKAANIIFQGIFANQTYEEALETLDLWYLAE